jgi:3-methyl-2-oxobutanoate hydroxymethyltransferase
MREKVTAPGLRAMRERGDKIVCLTAYDAVFAEMAEESGADVLLVGDSLGTVVLGYRTTVPVTLAHIEHHLRAVRTAVKRSLLVADLPFGTYEASPAQALESAVVLMKAGAEAVKLEGDYPEAVRALQKAGIPVMGHVGMTPQSVHTFGGHRVQGRGEAGDAVLETAQRLEEAGTFAIVLELVPAELGERITSQLRIPTIGIGAGPHCSGQIQVISDVLGFGKRDFRHAKRYADGRSILTEGLRRYTEEVRARQFPDETHSV